MFHVYCILDDSQEERKFKDIVITTPLTRLNPWMMWKNAFGSCDLQGFMVGFQPCELGLEEGEFLFLRGQIESQTNLNMSQNRSETYENQKVCDEVEKNSEKVSFWI